MREAALMIASQRDDHATTLLHLLRTRLSVWITRGWRALAAATARDRERRHARAALAAIARAGDHRLADLGLSAHDLGPVDLDRTALLPRGRWGEPG